MPLQIHNTLGNKTEPFESLNSGTVGMYVCGPTVYDYFHIGNARPFITFDVVKRFLIHSGYKVTHVQNVTDIDDKIIDRARKEKRSSAEVATQFTEAYFRDLGRLGVMTPTHNPKATETIPGIIDFIKRLESRGMAYAVDGDVFFKLEKFPSYGKLSGHKLEDLQQGASERMNDAVQERKVKAGGHPLDFALWKGQKQADEPAWDSPWGKGRPGWHIECSAMSSAILGETFDIHAGGQDLKFPHHENEIAQSEGASGKTFVRYWMHNGFINIGVEDTRLTNAQEALVKSLDSAIKKGDAAAKAKALGDLEAANVFVEVMPDGQIAFKGSKTLGNIPRTFEVFDRGFSGQDIRLLMLRAHYRGPITFSWKLLDEARSALQRWTTGRKRLAEALKAMTTFNAEGVTLPAGDELMGKVTEAHRRFMRNMNDDFNTPGALAAGFDIISLVNAALEKSGQTSPNTLQAAADALSEMEFVFGISAAAEAPLTPDEQALVDARDKARKSRQWAESDRLRDELANRGIIIEDSATGQKWRRK